MKSALALLFLVAFTAVGAHATAPSDAAGSRQSTAPGQPASFGDETSGIRRPTPTPTPTGTVSPKDKKPLTAVLGKDKTAKENVSTFASSDPTIYLVWKAETGSKGEKVHVAWYAVDTGGAISKNKKLTEGTQIIPAAGSISGSSFISKPAGGFPAGTYRADVADDGKVVISLKFTVKK